MVLIYIWITHMVDYDGVIYGVTYILCEIKAARLFAKVSVFIYKSSDAFLVSYASHLGNSYTGGDCAK